MLHLNAWHSFADPNLPISFDYPNPTPQGFAVNPNTYQTPASYRVHFVSDGSDEVYFEVGKYPDLDLREAVTEFLDGVKARINALQIGREEQVEVAGCPGVRLTIHWPGKARRVYFIERGDSLYRVIFNPGSEINKNF